MTRNRQRDRIGRAGARDGAHRARPADRGRDVRVGSASRRTESPPAPARPAIETPSPARRAADRAAARGRHRCARIDVVHCASAPASARDRGGRILARRARASSSVSDDPIATAQTPRDVAATSSRPSDAFADRRSCSRSACRRRRAGRPTAPCRASAPRARRSGCSIRTRRRASRR